MIWSKKKFKIVVLGAGRGGTSLIASLLDAHPKLEIALEAHAEKYLVSPARGPDALEEEKGLNLFVKACQKDAAQSHFSVWGNKITTEQLGFLEKGSSADVSKNLVYQQLLKKRKVIFITRDGRACIPSKMRRTDCDFETALNYWKHSVNYLRFLRRQKNLELFTLKFEDLLSQPQSELKRVCDFLNIDYHPEMLSGTASNRIHKDYRQAEINPEKAQLKPEDLALGERIADDLTYLGYTLTFEG